MPIIAVPLHRNCEGWLHSLKIKQASFTRWHNLCTVKKDEAKKGTTQPTSMTTNKPKYKLKPTKIEKSVVEAYKRLEQSVVNSYFAIENTVVGAYQKIEDKFVDTFLVEDNDDDNVDDNEIEDENNSN